MGPDPATAFVTPIPFPVPFLAPSLLAWETGIVAIWVIAYIFQRSLMRTAVGRWLLFIPMSRSFGITFLVLTLMSLIPTLGYEVTLFSIGATLRDLLIGLVWGFAFDVLTLLWLKTALPLAIRRDENTASTERKS